MSTSQATTTAHQIAQNIHHGTHNLAFICAVLFVISTISCAILFACSLQKTMNRVPVEKRIFPNWFIWMRFIPLFGLVFDWIMLPFGIPHGLRNTVVGNTAGMRAANALKALAFTYLILQISYVVLLSYHISMVLHKKMVPMHIFLPITFTADALLLFVFITYWIKIVSFRKKYLTGMKTQAVLKD